MELLVAADSLLYKSADGKYWCETIYGYDFWTRYLQVFDRVAIVSRTKHVGNESVQGYLRVDGPNIRIIELPYLRGMGQYVKHYSKFSNAAKEAVKNAECAMFRLPSVSASMVYKYYVRTGKPFAIEVVADPYDAYKSNKIAQIIYTIMLKKQTLKANGVSYVTRYYLQRYYPSTASKNGETSMFFETYYSTINLPYDYIASPKKYSENKKTYTIVHTANNINNDIKGHEVLIRIVKQVKNAGYDIKVIFIGDGKKRRDFELLAKQLGISSNISFAGLISSPQRVRDVLINGDMFVFPTKAEGLPRALIEAMAVGLPCLSTPVNGIPELLGEDYLFSPTDIDGFSKKIIQLINNPKELSEMSKANILKAKEYVIDILEDRRNQFYSKLKNIAINNKN